MTQFHQRRQRVREWLDEADLDAIIVSSAANVRYLSGFGGEGYLVLSDEAATVCTDSRYSLEAECLDGFCVIINANGYVEGALQWLSSNHASKVAFEGHALTYAQYAKLGKQITAPNLNSTSGVIEKLRLAKDAGELELIKKAAAIVSQSMAELLGRIEPGMAEREVAVELERCMVLGGAEAAAFPTIAASGPNAALPHARPGGRVLQSDEMVKVDAGCRVDGYCSDLTRTVWLGEPTEKFRRVYDAVLRAQEAALASVKAGVACAEVDRTARDVLAEAGLGDNFTHGVGHGVGLEVHEGPRLSARSEQVLQSGMVVTVEPGVYIKDWGGVRIEDLVQVTDDGCEILTNAPKMRR